MGGRIPFIPAIDSSDVSLMNLVRLNYDLQPQEVSVIIYVGVEFTRLIFMRGDQFYQFAPILGEGYDSPNLLNTVYSRLLLEQDNLAIPRINRIILAGESKRIGFRDFLLQQLPDQEVEYLLAPRLDTSELSAEQQESISDYAVPIGAAWKVLDTDNPNIYRINLLPAEVREGQRVFKLAWHGYLLLLLLFFSTIFFTWTIAQKGKGAPGGPDAQGGAAGGKSDALELDRRTPIAARPVQDLPRTVRFARAGLGALEQGPDADQSRRRGPQFDLALRFHRGGEQRPPS
jgi:hypothetical protein